MNSKFEVIWTDNVDGVDIDLLLQCPPISNADKDKLRETIYSWAYEGIEKGYGGGGYMHYIDDNYEWETINDKDYFNVFIDFGSADEEPTINALLKQLEDSGVPIEKVIFGDSILEIKERNT